MHDILTMVVGFHFHSTEILFQYDEEFTSGGNVVADEYFLYELEYMSGRALSPDFCIVGSCAFDLKKSFILGTAIFFF